MKTVFLEYISNQTQNRSKTYISHILAIFDREKLNVKSNHFQILLQYSSNVWTESRAEKVVPRIIFYKNGQND